MNEIQSINLVDFTPEGKVEIRGRQLHMKLNIGTEYAKWMTRMVEYGFIEGVDYKVVIVKNDENRSLGGRPSTDHILTLNMAKEIAMLQRTPEGQEIRRYLIKVEEDWNSPEKVMARAVLMANNKVKELTTLTEIQQATIEAQKPKVLFADTVSGSQTSILVRQLAKLVKQRGLDIGQNRLFKWLRDKGYLMKNKNEPTQRSMDLKVMEVKERMVNNPDGSTRITRTPMITGKGQIYFVDRLLGGKRKVEKVD
jgi:anti-repressor protein